MRAFYESILQGATPEVAQGQDTTLVMGILEDAERRMETELDADAEIESAVRRAIGGAYVGLGEADRAEAQLRRALELSRSGDPAIRAEIERELGTILLGTGDQQEEATTLIEGAVSTLEETVDGKDARLLEVTRTVPAKALAALREVELWMDVDYEGVPGGVYHPSRRWLVDHGYDPALARCIQFGNARNFLSWSFSQPSMVLHELAHAYHHQVLGYDEPTLLAAYERAEASGDYDEVLRYGGARERAYAMNNVQEYFAELTEAYFGTNDFHPFVKPELRVHDPEGFAAVESLWRR